MAAKSLCFRAKKKKIIPRIFSLSVNVYFRMNLKSFLEFTKITLKLGNFFMEKMGKNRADEIQNFTQ